jgi:hypothetical protein
MPRVSDVPYGEPGGRAAHDGLRLLRAALSAAMRFGSGDYGSQADTNKCQEEVNRHVNFVGTYRLCLTQEIERAVRETNGTLNRWKCSVAAKAPCQ